MPDHPAPRLLLIRIPCHGREQPPNLAAAARRLRELADGRPLTLKRGCTSFPGYQPFESLAVYAHGGAPQAPEWLCNLALPHAQLPELEAFLRYGQAREAA